MSIDHRLFIVTGPSGAGKDSIIDKMKDEGSDFYTVKTTTTRPMRDGEDEGNPYYFISKELFQQKIDSDAMLEWAEVYGNYYGSTKEEVNSALEKHHTVVFKVDPQGARFLKKAMPNAVTVFIVPPSFDFLEGRLRRRGQDSDCVIRDRLKVARRELAHLLDWDYVVVNEEGMLAQATQEVKEILRIH